MHAWIWPLFTHDVGPVKGVAGSGLRHATEVILSEGAERARKPAPDLQIHPRMLAGLPAEVLRRETFDAALLAVGGRGLGGFPGKLSGSVSADLAGACPCPVVAVWARRKEGKPVVACVDGRARIGKVLEQSVQVARALQRKLRIVHIDPSQPPRRRHAPSKFPWRDLLRNGMLTVQELDSDLAVTEDLISDSSAADALVGAGAEAELLVLGAHGREGHPGTAATVLTHAQCNVMIAR